MSPVPSPHSPLPPNLLAEHGLTVLESHDGRVHVGCHGPIRPALLHDLAFLSGLAVVPVDLSSDAEAPSPGTAEARTEQPPSARPLSEKPALSPERPAAHTLGERLPDADRAFAPVVQGPVVHQVDQLIRTAVARGASDIHLEPYESFYRLRYRLDGVLHHVGELSLLQREALISRVKIMAGLDIAEKRRPQDGRLRFQYGDAHASRTIDLRVSTLPTEFGEKIVLRILDKGHLRLDLEELGFDADALAPFRQAIHQPYGIILVSGPTGSGKTTTLYAALNELNTDSVNITTIEDPIEYNLPGINQTHVRADIGLTFAHALRAFLRQDPNIIMVGEIRDQETAEVAIRAALTGHLVLSTIHTNDAASTVTRLVDMGVEPFLVASSLRMAVAQRLVRRVCPDCRETTTPDPALAAAYGLAADQQIARGRGCRTCADTGYRGRVALFEVLPVSEALAERIMERPTAFALREQAVAAGMQTLRQAGLARIQQGITTPEEVLRETSL